MLATTGFRPANVLGSPPLRPDDSAHDRVRPFRKTVATPGGSRAEMASTSSSSSLATLTADWTQQPSPMITPSKYGSAGTGGLGNGNGLTAGIATRLQGFGDFPQPNSISPNDITLL